MEFIDLKSQYHASRGLIDRRIQEKEEEFENTRKNHQRAIDSMQAFGQLGQPSPLVMAAVSLLLIVAVGYVFARWDSVIGTLVATALVVLTAGVASFLLFAQGVWLDVAAPILGIQLHRLWASFEEQQHFRRLKKEHGHAHG